MMLCSVRSPRYAAPNPFTSFERVLQKSFDEAWGGLPQKDGAALSIRLDVKEDESAFHVTADLPGLTDKEVEVSFDDGVLIISGEKKITRDEQKEKWHIVERSSGSFARKLTLNAPVDAEKITAKFDKGVLNIILPKQEPVPNSARKIEINSA